MESPLPLNKKKPSDKPPKSLFKRPSFIIVITIVCVLIVSRYWVRTYKIASVSMEPTFYKGDQVVAVRVLGSHKLKRGDIIVFPFPKDKKRDWIKRIVGLPGEKLEIRQQQVYINDQPLDEPYVQHTEPPGPASPANRDDFRSLVIPHDQVFVLGDNRENSFDSRNFGLLPIKDISRKAKWILMSRKDGKIIYPWKRLD